MIFCFVADTVAVLLLAGLPTPSPRTRGEVKKRPRPRATLFARELKKPPLRSEQNLRSKRKARGGAIADQAARHGLGLWQYIDIVHKQHVYVSLAEGDDSVCGRANNWLVVIEGCIDDEGHLGTRKKTRYQLVKASI